MISIQNSPWIGVEKFIVTAHWSQSNVNFTVDDCAAYEKTCVVDAKDAKSIDPGDIPPVQKPMKTWKQRWDILPDDNWEKCRTNGITPMAHLFLESKVILKDSISRNDIIIPLTGCAAAVSLT